MRRVNKAIYSCLESEKIGIVDMSSRRAREYYVCI